MLATHAPAFSSHRFLVGLLRDGYVRIERFQTLPEEPIPFLGTTLAESITGQLRPQVAKASAADDRPETRPSPEVAVLEVAEASTKDASTDDAPESTRVKSDIEVALAMLAKGDNEAALKLLHAISRAHPGDRSVRQLVDEAESGLRKDLTRDDTPLDKVPTLVRPLRDLLRENLSPQEAFVAGLIDGTSDVRAITWVAPLRDLEVLALLKRLQQKGILTMPD